MRNKSSIIFTVVFFLTITSVLKANWPFIIGGSDYEEATSVIHTSDNYFIACGYTYSFGAGSGDYFVVKLDQFGNEIWSNTYGTDDGDYAEEIIETNDGGYAVIGSGGQDVWLLKINEAGIEEWSQTYDGSIVHSVQQTIDDGYILTGYINSSYYSDAWLLKTDELGNEVWNQTFDTDYDEEFRSVSQTIDGGYIMAGCTDKFSYSESDVLIVKTDVDGDEEWSRIYGYSGIDRANSVQQISENNFVVLGFTNLTGSPDFWLLRLGVETSINNNLFPNNKIFVNNFPNPFNPSTSIEFTINYNSHIELSIYNIKGQKIKTLAQNEFSKGSHLIIWNGDDEFNKPVSTGIYFYKLEVNGIIETMKKCLLLK